MRMQHDCTCWRVRRGWALVTPVVPSRILNAPSSSSRAMRNYAARCCDWVVRTGFKVGVMMHSLPWSERNPSRTPPCDPMPLSKLGDTLAALGRYAEAETAYERAHRHAVDSGIPELIGLTYGGLARLNMCLARMRTVDRLVEECVTQCVGSSRALLEARFMHLGAIASMWLADFESSRRQFETFIEKTMLVGDLAQALNAHMNLAVLLFECSEVEASRTHAHVSLKLAELTGDRRFLPIARAALVHCALLEGH